MTSSLSWIGTAAGDSLPLLLDTVVKATLLLAGAFLVSTLLRRTSAAVRHRVWCLTFAGLLLLPVLSSLLPGWRVPILPRVSSAEEPVAAAPDAMVLAEPGLPPRDPVAEYALQTSSNDASEGFDATLSATEIGENPGPSERAALPPASNDEIVSSGPTTPIISLSTLPCVVWVLGACAAVIPVLTGPWRTRLNRGAREIDNARALSLLRELCHDLDIGRTVTLLESDRPVVPMTWGVLHPIVLLPSTWRTWSEERLQFVLLHELAHVKRYDVAFQMFARVACAVYWFHPLAWWALARLRVERESACDDCVVTTGRRPSDYAKQLVEIARTHHFPATATAVAMARSSRLESRVRAVLDQARSHLPLSPRAARLFLVAAGLVVTLLAVVQPAARSAAKAEGDSEVSEATTGGEETGEAVSESSRPDLYGDPLPQGAVARLGTVRLRHEGWDKRIWILPDNKTLVSAATDANEQGNSVRIWDADTGKLKRELDFGQRRFALCGLTRDGTTFVTLTRRLHIEDRRADNELKAWDTSTWKVKSAADWTNTWSTRGEHMAVTPDGKTIVLVDHEGAVRFRDVASGEELPISTEGKYPVTSLAFSPDGKLLALASQGRQTARQGVFLWDWHSDRAPRRLPEKFVRPRAVRFSPNGRFLAIGSGDKPVQVWDVQSRQKVRQLPSGKLDYGRPILTFSPDGKRLAVPVNMAGHINPPHGSKIDLFDVETGNLVHSLDTGGWAPDRVAFSGDKSLLASVGAFETIRLWRMPEGTSLSERFKGHDQACYEIQFAPDGKKIVTGSMDGAIRVWDAESGRQVEALKHGRWVSGLAVSPDGRRILSCGFDDTVRLWDRESGKQLRKLKGHGHFGGNREFAIGFTPDGKQFTSFGKDMTLRTFNTDEGRMLSEHVVGLGAAQRPEPRDPFSPDGPDTIQRARLSADGTRLFLGTGGAVHIVDVASGERMDELDTEDSLNDLVVTPDRKRLVTIEQRRYRFRKIPQNFYQYKTFLRIRDLATKETIRQIEPPGWYAQNAAVSPDGMQLAVSMVVPGPTTPTQRWISVWDLRTGREVRRIEGIAHRPTKLAFSPDGRRLASALSDSTALVWDLDNFPVTSSVALKEKPQVAASGDVNVQDQIDAAVEKARKAEKRVLVIYGGDADKASRDLLKLPESDPALTRFKDAEFETVLVDVDPSKPVASSMPMFGVDLKQAGLPHLVILAADGKVVAKGRAFDSASGTCWDAETFDGFLKKWAVPKSDAGKLFEEALARAKKEDKKVLVHLSAPWCGSCLRLDAFLKEHKQIFERDYVLLKIDIERMGDGKTVASQLGASLRSVPWIAIVDVDGKPLITSDRPDGNLGLPENPEGIAYFLKMIGDTSSRITEEQLERIGSNLGGKESP